MTKQKEMKLVKLFEKSSIFPHTIFTYDIYLLKNLNTKCQKYLEFFVLNNTFKNLILKVVTFYLKLIIFCTYLKLRFLS